MGGKLPRCSQVLAHHNLSSLVLKAFSVCAETTSSVREFHLLTTLVSKVAPPLSSCHTFLLELQAVSPRHCAVVHLKWHFVDFVDTMQIFVDFDHVSSCFSVVQAW